MSLLLLFAASGGGGGASAATVKCWDGAAFTAKPLMRFNGSTFEPVPADRLKYWNGSAFVPTSS